MNEDVTFPSFPLDSQADRVAGTLLGLAAGDTLSGPIYLGTTIAESLLVKRRYDMIDVAERHFAWWQQGAKNAGPTFEKVMTFVADGVQLDTAVSRVHREGGRKTAGCAPLHRATPIAMLKRIPTQQLAHFAELETAISHWDPVAAEATAAIVVLCRALIEGTVWQDALREAGYGHTFRITQALQPIDLEHCKTSGYALHVLQAAVSILTYSSNLQEALDTAKTFSAPMNYVPVLVGTLGGARWGASRLSEEQLAHTDQDIRKRFYQASTQLAHDWL